MNAANIDRSARLQRVLAVLGDYRPHTTRELIDAAHVCAVSSIAAELRANGFKIVTECQGRGRFTYQLQRRAPEQVALFA